MCKWYPEDELVAIARDYLLDDVDINADWTMRHGRSIALRTALSEAPKRIVTAEWSDRIIKTLLSYLTSDRIPLVTRQAYKADAHSFARYPVPNFAQTMFPVSFFFTPRHNSGAKGVAFYLKHAIASGAQLQPALITAFVKVRNCALFCFNNCADFVRSPFTVHEP